MKKKRWFGILMSLLIGFGSLFQCGASLIYADELSNVITGASITDTSGNPITGTIAAWHAFRINADYILPNNSVHEGDTTTITLPVGVVPASPNAFEIKDGSNVIATGRVVDGKPGKVILTYTSYVEGKSDIRGKFFFNVQIDNSVYTSAQQIPVNLTVNGETVPAGAVNYKLGEASLQPVIKSGWMWSQDSTVGIYQIKINQENKELINAKITDTLLNPGVTYIPGTVEVFQGKWEMTPSGDDVKMTDPVTVTSQYADKITYNGSGFTINIGNLPAGTGLWFRYRVKLAYQPIAGEKFVNRATFTNDVKTYNHSSSYQIYEAGGSGEGYVFSLVIKKTDTQGNPLKGAIFDVIRVRSGQVVGRITSDEKGQCSLKDMLKDKYIIREVKAPHGFIKSADIVVDAEDFDSATKTALKTIPNTPENTSVAVTKKWIGKEGDSAKIYLYADGEKAGAVTLNKSNSWQHTFVNLKKYNDGREIVYTVKEERLPGYTTSITGDAEAGFIVTNTEDAWETPKTPKPNNSNTVKITATHVPKTGDSSNILLYGAALLGSIAVIAFSLWRRKQS